MITFDFEVSSDAIKPYCGVVMCDCNGRDLGEEEGYLYIPPRLVKRRTKQREIIYDYVRVEHQEDATWVDTVLNPAPLKSIRNEGRENIPIRLCKKAAKELGLNLDIAEKDFQIWKETERVPLRITPKAIDKLSSYEDSLPKIEVERTEANGDISCKIKFEKKHPNRIPLFEELISAKKSFSVVGVGSNEERAREDIATKDLDLEFVTLDEEKVYPALTGVLRNIGAVDEDAVKKYMLDDNPNFINKGEPTIQAFILLEDPDFELISVTITKIERIKNGASYLGGLIKFTPRFNVYWEQECNIVREFTRRHVIDYYYDLNQTTDDLNEDELDEKSINLVDRLNITRIETRYGIEASRIFEQMQSSLDGNEFVGKIREWGYELQPSDHSSQLGITFESAAGIIMVRVKKADNKIADIVYADHSTKIAIRLVAKNGTITCSTM